MNTQRSYTKWSPSAACTVSPSRSFAAQHVKPSSQTIQQCPHLAHGSGDRPLHRRGRIRHAVQRSAVTISSTRSVCIAVLWSTSSSAAATWPSRCGPFRLPPSRRLAYFERVLRRHLQLGRNLLQQAARRRQHRQHVLFRLLETRSPSSARPSARAACLTAPEPASAPPPPSQQ